MQVEVILLLAFVAVTKQLQVHYHLVLDWSVADPDLHINVKTKTDYNQICALREKMPPPHSFE